MQWDLKSDRPIYIQLVEHIEQQIISGKYPPGSRLPSVRDLAQEAAVNPNTMQRALAKLEENGLIITNRTVGRTVTEDTDMIKQARDKAAREKIMEFLESMKLLGFEKQEMLLLINKMLEEMKQ
jgi:GntR family transcriptional regulator